MSIIAQNDAIQLKTRELCQTILDEPVVQEIRLRIDQFMINDEAKTQCAEVYRDSMCLTPSLATTACV